MATSPIYSWPEPDNTDLVKNGALAIRTLGNAIDTTMGTMVAKTIIDAKGDLIAGTAADTAARLAVGNNGETLVADSSTSTGLRYQSNFAAGKNAIINGAFNVWQRGTSFTLTTNVTTYTADRFMVLSTHSSGSTTVTQQTFTPGTAPVAGYEGQYYFRITNSAATTNTEFQQRVEDVRTFAGQTVTVSFWAKASSAVTMANAIIQNFGSGGSGNVTTTGTSQTLTTSWARYSTTINVPSISGKTVGTSSYLQVYPMYYSSGTLASNVIDIWGVQVEAGSTATAFQTATGTIQGELAACQRYYFRSGASNGATTSAYNLHAQGYEESATSASICFKLPVTMRVAPTAIEYANVDIYDSTARSLSALTINGSYNNTNSPELVATGTGMAQYRPCFLLNWNNTGGYVALTAEL